MDAIVAIVKEEGVTISVILSDSAPPIGSQGQSRSRSRDSSETYRSRRRESCCFSFCPWQHEDSGRPFSSCAAYVPSRIFVRVGEKVRVSRCGTLAGPEELDELDELLAVILELVVVFGIPS